MRKIKLYIANSLDGKIARKDDRIDWLPSPTGDDYGYKEFYSSIDTTLMGYRTYEVCLKLGDWYYKNKTNYVFSRDPSKKIIPEARLVSENPVQFVKRLKESPGKDIWLIGGGEIITLLHDAGLIDEYIIAYIPLILGEGIELFPNVKNQENLKLVKHQVYPNGVVLLYLEK
jgi:dihydrofolate reductase